MRVDADGISITASDGRTFTLKRADVVKDYDARSGQEASRLSATVESMRSALLAALGPEQIDAASIDLAFTSRDGTAPLVREIRDVPPDRTVRG